MRVFHDPGHGGSNKGVCYGGLIEKDWTLRFVHDFLDWCGCDNRYGSPVKQWMARVSDTETPYDTRGKLAQDIEADFVFIHHVNGMFWPQGGPFAGEARSEGHGLSLFVHRDDRKAFDVAKGMLDTYPPQHLWKSRTLPFIAHRLTRHGKKHWTLNAYSHLRHYHRRGIPSILIEWMFATNDSDRRLLCDPTHRERMFKTLETAIDEMAKVKA
jgi:N-acetylmuramoyl-L-alanine amidase